MKPSAVSTPLRGFFVAEGKKVCITEDEGCFNPLAGFFCCREHQDDRAVGDLMVSTPLRGFFVAEEEEGM